VKRPQVGIPKGSLENATIELFRKSGGRSRSVPELFPSVDDENCVAPWCGPRRCHGSWRRELSMWV